VKKFNRKGLIFVSLVVISMLLFAGCQKEEVGSLMLNVEGPEEAQITVENGTTKTETVQGSQKFEELPAGEYTITAESDGYQTAEKTIVIKAGETTTDTVRLVANDTTPQAYNVKVNVVDKKGKKVSGTADIIDPEGETTTEQVEDGLLEFKATPGEYTVKVEKEGYGVIEKTVTVGNEDKELDITLQTQSFDLAVNVVDGNGNPLRATIDLQDDEEVQLTKENSAVTFEGLSAGEYRLEVARKGYEKQVKEVKLTADKEVSIALAGGQIKQHLIKQDNPQGSVKIENLAADEEAIVAASYLNMEQNPQDFDGNDLEYKARQRGLKLIEEYGANFKTTEFDYSVGETKEFAISDDVKAGQITATLEAKGEHVYVFVDNNEEVSQAKLDSLVTEFDSNIYPRLTPDQPATEKAVVVLTEFDKVEDKPYVTGFFDPVDLYQGEGNQQYMFYLNSTRPKNTLLAAAAHQYQHLVFFTKKAELERTGNDAWIDQGIAHLSSQLCNYINFGEQGWSDEKANGWVYDDDYGYLNNTGNVNVLYHDGSLPFTGGSGLLTAYLVEQHGPELIQQIMTSAQDPVTVIEEYTGRDFEQIYANWVTANVADNISEIENEVYKYNAFDLNMMPKFKRAIPQTGVNYFKVSGTGGDVSIDLPKELRDDLLIVVVRKAK